MSIARTFFRLMFAAGLVNAVGVACVVSDDDDDDDATCTPGETAGCTCADGTKSEKTCRSTGDSYGLCECASGSGGSSSTGGSNGTAGEGTGGQAGATGDAGASQGGAAAGGEAAGGATADGKSGEAGETGVGGAGAAGAGGGGGAAANECSDIEPDNACDTCVFDRCCSEFSACLDDAECFDQWANISACAEVEREDATVSRAIFAECAGDGVMTSDDPWASEVKANTKALVDCVAGGEAWDTVSTAWNADTACSAGCFVK